MPPSVYSSGKPKDWGNPVESPSYFIAEAAHHLRLPRGTVRDWVLGREYPTDSGTAHSTPLIVIADPNRQLLSFLNLVELHVISSIRRVHRVKPKPLRKAIDYLKKTFSSKHPLLDKQMLTDGTSLFIERYGNYVDISADGQLAIKDAIDAYLKRVEWDEDHIPIRLFPVTRPKAADSPNLIAIDPRVRFGRPCIAGTRLPTSIIAERHTAGESVAALAADYGRQSEEIEEAIRYESRVAS